MKRLALILLGAGGLAALASGEARANDGYGGSFGRWDHRRYHADLDHRDLHRELEHRDAHRYPLNWRQHERLHDGLEHSAFHDRLEHRLQHSGRYGHRVPRYGSGFSYSRRGLSLWLGR